MEHSKTANKYACAKEVIRQYREPLEGKFPKKLKKGVLSEDGIYNMLERNKEIMKILDGFDS